MNKAFFLDRDGVINVETGYLHEVDRTVVLDNIWQAIKMIHDHGFLAIAVTNQAGVAKGYYPESDIQPVHAAIQRQLLAAGGIDALIDGWYYCPHHPEFTGKCDCRKPGAGMLKRAAADFDIDLSASFIIGDRISDLGAGVNAGCAGECLVLTGYGEKVREEAGAAGFPIAADLPAAVKKMLEISGT